MPAVSEFYQELLIRHQTKGTSLGEQQRTSAGKEDSITKMVLC